MAYFTTTAALPYFNTNWAILSTIGISLCFVGVLVLGIKGRVTALLLVPIVVSAACAIANGLHYYQTFVDCPTINQAVALVLADIAWMVSASFCSNSSSHWSLSPFFFICTSISLTFGDEHVFHRLMVLSALFRSKKPDCHSTDI